MKNKFIYLMLMAAAVIASCAKENTASIEENSVSGLVFSSAKPAFSDETKTAWTGTSVQWSKGDKIRVAYTCNDVWQNADGTAKANETTGRKTAKMYQSTALSTDSETAQFNVPTDFKGTVSGTYQFYALYPDTCVPVDFTYAPSASVTIPTNQTPAADSFDSSADIMVGKSVETYTGLPTEAVSILWSRLVAHTQFTFKAINGFTEGETIKSISLTANSDADMVGLHYVDVLTESVTKPSSNTTANSLTISGDNLTAVSADGLYNIVAWASFLPCTMTSLNVVITTDKATYTREISDISLVFLQNARNTLTVNMSGAVRDAKEVGKSLPFNEDFSSITAGNSTAGGSGFKVTPEQMSQFANYADATYQAGNAIRIGKSGSVETVSLDLSEEFSVVISAKGWSSSENILTVSVGAQSQDIQLTTWMSGEYQQYALNFDAEGTSETVKFTTTSSVRCFIDDIRILSGHASLPPVIAVADTGKPSKVDAAGDVVTIPYTIKNPVDGVSVSASVPDGIDWIHTFDYSTANEISFIVDGNTESTERSSVVTLSYEGSESVEIPIVQKAAGSTGVETKTFKISSSNVVSNSAYTKYSATIDNRSWLITFGGNNSSVGTSSKQRKNCTLSSYSKYAVSPVTTSSTASAFASTSKLSSVTGISYGAITSGRGQANTKIYVIYSTDDKTYSQIELTKGTQGTFNKDGDSFEFASLSGYFAVVFQATNTSGNWRLDDVSLTFTYTE